MRKQKITTLEIWLRIAVMISAVVFAYLGNVETKQYLSLFGLMSAFAASVYLHRHFFPFIVAATLCYLLAILQEFFSPDYAYLPVTVFLWTAGNILLPIGFFDLIYRLIFNYEISDKP